MNNNQKPTMHVYKITFKGTPGHGKPTATVAAQNIMDAVRGAAEKEQCDIESAIWIEHLLSLNLIVEPSLTEQGDD